jgi:hypothetical protein
MKTKIINLEAEKNAEIVVLKAKKGQPGIEVDAEAGIIRNVSFITAGPAVGHGFDVDSVMLKQVEKGVNGKKKGVMVRLTHPEASFFSYTDPATVLVGRAKNAVLKSDQVRGDVHFADYADLSPSGKLKSYLLAVAEEDPEAIGLSISFVPDEFEKRTDENKQSLPPAGRIRELIAIDFVGDPAANPKGLLSRGNETKKEGTIIMNEKIKKYLMEHGMLSAGCTDEEAKAAWEALSAEQRGRMEVLAEKVEEPEVPKTSDAPETPGTPDTPETPGTPGTPETPADGGEGLSVSQQVAVGLAADRERYKGLNTLAKQSGFGDDWVSEQYLEGTSLAAAQKLALDKLAKDRKPVAGLGGSLRVGEDRDLSTLAAGITDAVCLRAGVNLEKPHERAEEFQAMRLLEMGRTYLESLGVTDARQLHTTEVASLLMVPGKLANRYPQVRSLAQSTGDFDYILEDAMGKSLRQAYEDAPTTWQIWARRAMAPDFKDIKRVAISEAPNLVARYEGQDIDYVTLSDSRETYALVEFTNGIILTRKTLINDDLDAFGRIPRLQGNAARRLEDVTAYAILTANAALADSVTLFHASHSNYTASGAAPSVATLGVGRAAMRIQTGPKSAAILNLTPRALIVPAALETTAEQLIASVVDPTKSNQTPNPFSNKLQVVTNGILDATSTTVWYLAADSNEIDTVEVCFLEGEQVPQLEQETVFGTGDRKYAIRHTVAAKAIDHRGLYKNAGA